MLVIYGAIRCSELPGWDSSRFHEMVPETARHVRQYTLDFHAVVHVVNRPDLCGMFRDLRRSGLHVKGI